MAEYEDSGVPDGLGRVRFYAAAVVEDTDGDGLSDGFEYFITHTDAGNNDSDGDGLDDLAEHMAGSDPATSNAWWMVTTTNEIAYWEYIGWQASWTSEPNERFSTNVVSSLTNTVRVLKDVRIDGHVDGILRIDTFEVDESHGPKRFSNQSITNISPFLDAGILNLALFDCPAQGHSGHNEVRLGDTNGPPFRVMRDWLVPIDIRMEAIWASENLPLDNPSGIILGSHAWFHVDVIPDGVVPEEKSVWESQGGKLEFVTTNAGSRVEVCATNAGDGALHVTIDGATGNFNLPPFHVKVAPLTVITANVGVVRAQNNELAASAQKVENTIHEANQILLQAGLQLVASEPVEIPDIDSYFDVVIGSLGYHLLLGSFPQSNQLEIYFVGTITHPDFGPADGMHAQGGLLIATNGTGRTLGHEIAHRYWLRDVYISRDNVPLEASGPLCEERMPLDWGNYAAGMDKSMDIGYIMPRLLMYGVASSEKGDIARGEFYGLGWQMNGTNVEWNLRNQSVGLCGMTNLPMQSN